MVDLDEPCLGGSEPVCDEVERTKPGFDVDVASLTSRRPSAVDPTETEWPKAIPPLLLRVPAAISHERHDLVTADRAPPGVRDSADHPRILEVAPVRWTGVAATPPPAHRR